MLVGLNLLYLRPGEVGGTEAYARALIEAFADDSHGHRFLVFVSRQAAQWRLPESSNIQRVECPVDATGRAGRYWFEQLHLPREVKTRGVELLHSAGYVGPVRSPCPHVITLHDVNFVGHGSAMSLGKRMTLGAAVLAAVHACDHVITVSHFSRSEALRYLRLPPSKVTAVHSAGGLVTHRSEQGAPPRPQAASHQYVIALSSQSRHKNLVRLVRAFGGIKERIPHHLVIAGHPPEDPAFRAAIEDYGLQSRVQITGYLDEKSLRGYLAAADLFVFPSLYEGFGLPALEAQALGTAMVCSDRASLPEVAGKGALYFNPESESEMAEAILRVLLDEGLRQSLVAAGYENLAGFRWAKTAQETAVVYERTLRQYVARKQGL